MQREDGSLGGHDGLIHRISRIVTGVPFGELSPGAFSHRFRAGPDGFADAVTSFLPAGAEPAGSGGAGTHGRDLRDLRP